MKTAVITTSHTIEIQDLPCPQPKSGEVRIRLHYVSICGSDVHLYTGDWQMRTPFPVRAGHEGLGVVDAVGDGVTRLQVGQRVVIEPNIPCGNCRTCWRGKGNICPNKRITGVFEAGCFAEYAVYPAEFVWAIPDNIGDEDAVLIEPTAVSLHALQTATLRPGDTIGVIGLGAIGLLLTHIALAVGYNVVVKDRVLEKMALAESWGATAIGLDGKRDVIEQLTEQFDSADVTAIFECGGTARTAEMSIAAAPAGAQIVIVGLAHEPVSFIPLELTRRGQSIITSMIYDHPTDFNRTIELIANNTIQPSRIISRRCDFSEIRDALAHAATGKETKVILKI